MGKKYILLAFLMFSLHFVFAINPYIKNLSIESGLPSNKIFYAYQDSHNFMWFGTDAGVIRFDGTNIVHFKTNDGLSDNITIRIKEDISGRIWFMNLNGTVNYFYKNKIYNDKNDPLLEELKSDFYIIDFFEDIDSTQYFYNSISEVFVVNNYNLTDYQKFEFSNSGKIGDLLLLEKGTESNINLWASKGVYNIKSFDETPEIISQTELLQKVFKVDKNEYIALDRQGFLHLYKGNKQIKEKLLKSETLFINDLLIDKDSFMWMATYDKGIFCYQNDSLLLHLDIDHAQNMHLDSENNIWISSEKNGIYKVNRDILKYTFLGLKNFNGDGIIDMAPENSGNIFATNGSSLYLIRKNKVYTSNLKIEGEEVNNIIQLKNNTVFINGVGTQPYILRNTRFDLNSNSIKSNLFQKPNYLIKKTYADPEENWLFSHMNDELIVIYLNKKYFVSDYISLDRGRINSLFFTNKGDFIVNTTENYLISIDTVNFHDSKIGPSQKLLKLSGKTISSHLKMDDENELFNVLGNEIYLLNDTTFYEITRNLKSQINYRIKDLAFDGATLFFYTSKTVYFITNPRDIINGEEMHLNRLNIEFNNINDILCQDSTLYVASDGGIMCIPIKECVNAKVNLPEPYFSKVSLNDEDYNINTGIVEFKNKKRLSIEFASLNYSSFPSNYSYMLEGIDENWIQGNETRVVYLNLPPGSYSFKLKARKSTEAYSEEIVLPIIIKPTVFQRPIIKLFILVVLLFGLFTIFWIIYTDQIKKKETDSLLITLEHKALQSMMNPHFIFNALGSIQRFLLQNKAEEAGTYLSQFARLIRQNMNSLKSNLIYIDDEVERLRNYMDLEKFRMNNKFDYSIHVDEKIDGDETGIPSMIVQPFVENAIWHGVSSLPEGGLITVQFNIKNEKSISIIVEDNGAGIQKPGEYSKSEQNLNMGVSITQKRLKLIGEKFGIESLIITENRNTDSKFPGTRVIITVPILT